MGRVVYFEISADDPDRANTFYENVFGWKTRKWEGYEDYWYMTTGDEGEPGIDGGLMRRKDPSLTTMSVIQVPSLDQTIARISEHGGEMVMPKFTIPGVGYVAYFKDTEGNTFGALQKDGSAELTSES